MRYDSFDNDLQEDKTCPCQSPEAKLPRPPFPLWVIPGAVFMAITLGYVALKIVGCHYFLWVHILWPISALLFFFMLAQKNTPFGSTARVIGITLAIILTIAAAGKAFFFIESVSFDKKYVFVSDIEDRYILGIIYAGPLVYEYQNFIWYGPLLDRWCEYFGGAFDYDEYFGRFDYIYDVDFP